MLRRVALILFSVLSVQAAAGTDFGFLPAQTGAQKELRGLVANGHFRQALMAWNGAYANTGFVKTQTAVAGWSYLLYQNNLPYLALHSLLEQTQPQKIDRRVLALWKPILLSSPYIQKGWIETRGRWRRIVDNSPIEWPMKNVKSVDRAFKQAKRLNSDQVNRQARIWWRIATMAPQFNDTYDSLTALSFLEKSKQNFIGQDQIELAKARVLYQRGRLQEALQAYDQIPKNSNLWLVSVEEKAWDYLRQSDYDKTLGQVTTLLSPVLAPLSGPEGYLVSDIMALKVCDYPRIFKTSETFKKRHHDRLKAMQELANRGTNDGLNAVLGRMDQDGVTLKAAGAQVTSIPQNALRDQSFLRDMNSRHELLSEINTAGSIIQDAQALGGGKELQASVEKARGLSNTLRRLGVLRLRELARQELGVYRNVLNKMQVIEAEVIERLHLDDNLKGVRPKLAKAKDKGDVLVFPYDPKDVWMDELDNYKAQVKDCPTYKGASL